MALAEHAADPERDVLVLAYRDELTQSEIADRLGWPLGTVKTRTRRALLKLRAVARPRPGADARCRPMERSGSPSEASGASGEGRVMIDHAEVRERLELAAVEPGELDRLAAGDTVDSAAIAGHLAGCRGLRRRGASPPGSSRRPVIAEVAAGAPSIRRTPSASGPWPSSREVGPTACGSRTRLRSGRVVPAPATLQLAGGHRRDVIAIALLAAAGCSPFASTSSSKHSPRRWPS